MSGRKSKAGKIEQRWNEIVEWLKAGRTEKWCARKLEIGYSTWNKYKKEIPGFAEMIKENRKEPVEELEDSIFKRATGFTVTVRKAMKVKTVEYENGKRLMETERMEYYDEDEYFPPETTAAIFLLKHWAKDKGYTSDPQMLEIKKQELQIKQEAAEKDNW